MFDLWCIIDGMKGETYLIGKEVVIMARLTNEQIRNMSLNEADIYTNLHPAEAWRFSKAHGRSATKLAAKAIKHGFKNEILFAEPANVKVSAQ